MSNRLRFGAIPFALAAVALLGVGTNVHVPYATPVIVHVKSEVSSAHAAVGDAVAIEVSQDVVVDGYVVISRGADGVAEVAAVTAAAASAPGQVQLTFKWVHAVDGSKIGVVGQQVASGGTSAGKNPAASLNGVQNAAQDSGVNSSGVNKASGFLARFQKVASDLGVSPGTSARGGDGALEPDKAIPLSVKNPNGVAIVSSTRAVSGSDDSDVK